MNPKEESEEASDMELVVAGTSRGLLMVEGFANFVSEEKALSALNFAHESMRPIFEIQEDLRKKTGSKQKREVPTPESDPELEQKVKDLVLSDLEKALSETDKVKRYGLYDEIKTKISENFSEEEDLAKKAKTVFEHLKYEQARSKIVEKTERIDGRKMDEVRPIACEVDLLPRVHGSALFTRGETQVLGALTLGTGDDEKIIDNLWNSHRKKFFLHYNFPPFCVGETGRLGGQSRREIGHGFFS